VVHSDRPQMAAQYAEEQTPFAYQITKATIHTDMTLTLRLPD